MFVLLVDGHVVYTGSKSKCFQAMDIVLSVLALLSDCGWLASPDQQLPVVAVSRKI